MKHLLFGGLSALLFSACVVGPDYQPPFESTESAYSALITQQGALIHYGEEADAHWWRALGDPALDALIAEARAANPDLRQAVARLEEARARALGARARLLPVVNADASARQINASEAAGAFSPPPQFPEEQSDNLVEANVGWEIDLFGRLRRRAEAAGAQAEASAWDRRDILLSITAQVASEYAGLVALNQQIAVADENLDAAKETVRLTRHLLEAELGSRELLLRALADQSSAEADLKPLVAARHGAAARLAILLGRVPGPAIQELIDDAKGPLQTPTIPVGLPSDLIRRRPDVRAAERRLAAATASIGAETADLFPSFELTAAYGSRALSTDLLFEAASESWSYGGGVRVPLFDLARQKSDVEAAEASAASSLAAFDAAVLEALAEVEIALSSYVANADRLASLEAAVDHQADAVELARLRFERGLASGIDVLDAQRRLFALRAQAASAQADTFRAFADAHLALGGGWEGGFEAEHSCAAARENGPIFGQQSRRSAP